MTATSPDSRQRRSLVAPELRAWLDAFPALELNAETLAVLRASGSRFPQPPLSREQERVRCEERLVPGPTNAPPVRVLVYTPPQTRAALRPAFLHMHGGGFVLGTPEVNDAANRGRAVELDCVVVSVDYRLAPETPFPGAVEDCYAALVWIHREAEILGVDSARIAIGGESAGAGHAATLARLARERGVISPCLQMLDSPMLDDRTGSIVNPHENGVFIWSPAHNRFGWRALLGMEPGGPDVPTDAAPARFTDLAGLAPAFIIVGALDLFLEECLDYTRRLVRAGIAAELHVIPGAYHGYTIGATNSPQAQTHARLRHDALARAFASRA